MQLPLGQVAPLQQSPSRVHGAVVPVPDWIPGMHGTQVPSTQYGVDGVDSQSMWDSHGGLVVVVEVVVDVVDVVDVDVLVVLVVVLVVDDVVDVVLDVVDDVVPDVEVVEVVEPAEHLSRPVASLGPHV